MQILADTYSKYSVIAVIILTVVITWMFVRRCSKKSRFFVGLSGGVGILFILALALTFFEAKYTFRIIRVEDDFKCTILRVIGGDSGRWFQNSNNVKVKYGETYIDNLSNKDIIIEPVTYSNSEFMLPHHSDIVRSDEAYRRQRIPSHSVAVCEIDPDYYFLAPNSIMVERKKGDSYHVERTKWMLRYSNSNDDVVVEDL